jgi:hypothetical protein
MSDFEVHERGTATELRLSRALAQEITQTLQQYGKVIPSNVLQAYYALMNEYAKAISMQENA